MLGTYLHNSMSPKPAINTLSRKRRRVYFQLLLVAFLIVAPVLFLSATGYRFETLTGLTKTGGIYVGAEQLGAEIYINGELVHETGTFRRAFYVQDLKPGIYTISVSKEGFYPWDKTLEVYESIVTEGQAFNMPEEPVLTLIPATFTYQTANATTTALLPNPLYQEIAEHFTEKTATSTKKTMAARGIGTPTTVPALVSLPTATTTKAFLGMQLSDGGGRIIARWMRDTDSVPFYFCIRAGECVDEIVLNTRDEKPISFDFFPGTTDLALVTLKDGVYVTELDNRSGQNIQPLFLAAGVDFRIIDGDIYVKTPSEIYKVEI